MALAAVHSKAVVLFLFCGSVNSQLIVAPIVCGFLSLILVCYAGLSVLSSLSIIYVRKRHLLALL